MTTPPPKNNGENSTRAAEIKLGIVLGLSFAFYTASQNPTVKKCINTVLENVVETAHAIIPNI